MKDERIAWPNAAGVAWPSAIWGTQDAVIGTATFSQQAGFGRIATSATGNMYSRAISTNQLWHQDIEWRGSIRASVGNTNTLDFFLRSDGAWGGTGNLPNNAYAFEFDMTGSAYNAYKVVSNVPSDLVGAPAATAFTFTANTTYNIYLVLRKYFCGIKIWAAGTNEPGQFGWSFTDPGANIAATVRGYVQISSFQTPATATNVEIGPAVLSNSLANRTNIPILHQQLL